jgi:energy-coupling factor transport system substrate-specific component
MKDKINLLKSLVLAVILGIIAFNMVKAGISPTLAALAWGVMAWYIIEFLFGLARITGLSSFYTEYTTYDIMVMAALIAAGGIVKAYWGQLRLIFESLFGPYGSGILGGGFYFWAVLACYLVRKPLTGTISMVLGGVVEILAGNPFGLPVLLFNFWEGLGPDIAYGLFRLKKYTLGVAILAGLLAAYFGVVYGWYYFGFQYLGLGPFLVYLVSTGIGGLLGGVLGHYVGMALERVGVRPPAKAVIESA